MINNSRIGIYDYLHGLMVQVTPHVHDMSEPTETTPDEAENGFVVVLVGRLNDESEFYCDSYIWARCFVTAYIPKKSRGRLNKALYGAFETGINNIIESEQNNGNSSQYFIVPDSVISMDDDEISQKGNQFHVFTKSFIVGSDYKEQ